MRVLFVYKENRQDPCLQALKRWLPGAVDVVGRFAFAADERGRFESATALPRFCAEVERTKPDVVFVWTNYLNLAEVEWCHRRGVRVLSAINSFTSFNVGHIRNQRATFDLLKALDWYFVPHGPHVPVLRDHGVNAHEMPFFYDPAVYKPLPRAFRLFDVHRWDAFFAGGVAVSWARNRRALVERLGQHARVCLLANINPQLKGVSWYGAMTIPSVVNWMMNRSRVVLGSDFLPSVGAYHAMQDDIFVPYDVSFTIRSRVFTAIGSGRPFMVERHDEIERFFEDGRDIVLWSTLDEAVERLMHLIRHPEECERIARAGYEKVSRLHTAEARLREMFDIVRKEP